MSFQAEHFRLESFIILTGPTGCRKSSVIRKLAMRDAMEIVEVLTIRPGRNDDPTQKIVSEDDFENNTDLVHRDAYNGYNYGVEK